MNAARRKIIDQIIALLEEIKPKLEDAKSMTETLADEEREAYDNMPEGLQRSEKGEASDNAATQLEEVKDALEIDIDDLISKLNDAQA